MYLITYIQWLTALQGLKYKYTMMTQIVLHFSVHTYGTYYILIVCMLVQIIIKYVISN